MFNLIYLPYVTYKMKTNFEVRQAKNEYDDDI